MKINKFIITILIMFLFCPLARADIFGSTSSIGDFDETINAADEDMLQFFSSTGLWTRIQPVHSTATDMPDTAGTNTDHDNRYLQRTFVNGSFKETFDAFVTSDGATIDMTLEQSNGGGDLIMQFSDFDTPLDCTPICTIELTAGSDIAPQANWIYIPQSTKVLTKSTSAWPTTEHIKVGFFFVQSATFVNIANRGALINQNWNDHLAGTNNMGHMLHMAEVIRMHTGYFKGIDGNGSDNFIDIVTNVGTPDDVYIKTTSGFSYQAHLHSVPAKDMSDTDVMHVVNHNTTPYDDITNLNTQLTDADGDSMSGKYFNIIFGVIANKTGEYTPLVMNLPTGSYNNLSTAIADSQNYDVLSGPREFLKDSTTGIFVARITFKHSVASGGTWTVEATKDLRAGILGGGSLSSNTVTNFADNQFTIFDETDITKIVDFQASGITTGNTRTLTIPDVSDTIAVVGTDNDFSSDQSFQVDILLDEGQKLILNADDGSDTYIVANVDDSLSIWVQGVEVEKYTP